MLITARHIRFTTVIQLRCGTVKRARATKIITARVTIRTKNMIHEVIQRDTHLNESDFLRAAVREKLKRDAPQLYIEMMTTPMEQE